MDFATAFGVLLALVAMAVTVTPRITNWWVAGVAWGVAALYTVWLLSTRQAEVLDLADRYPGFSAFGAVAIMCVAVAAIGLAVHRQARIRREASEARRKEFESFPADLGIVDHGVNLTSSLQGILDLLKLTVPPMTAITDRLFKVAPKLLEKKHGFREIPAKKQAIHKASAEMLREHVLALEDIAKQVKPHAGAFVDAYRAMFKLPIATAEDAQALRKLRETYVGGVAESFQKFSTLARANGRKVALMNGYQQDLTRVVARTGSALDDMAESADVVATFCLTEMPDTIDRLLANHPQFSAKP